jgi:prephenate dehydratase
MSSSSPRLVSRAPLVAYQGGPGAYGEAAVGRYWNGEADPVPVRSFPAVLAAVAAGDVDFGVVPVWNAVMGAVREACDAIAAAGDRVREVGEVTVPVRHALLALPGATLAGLRAVGSHGAALAQCRRFFAAHPHAAPVVAWDTAGAARELAALGAGRGPESVEVAAEPPWWAAVPGAGPETLAAIASAAVAARHGLAVLADDVGDDPHNATRFAVVRAQAPRPDPARDRPLTPPAAPAAPAG